MTEADPFQLRYKIIADFVQVIQNSLRFSAFSIYRLVHGRPSPF